MSTSYRALVLSPSVSPVRLLLILFYTIFPCSICLYITRNLSRAQKYCRDIYADSMIERYGRMASPKAMRVEPWYNTLRNRRGTFRYGEHGIIKRPCCGRVGHCRTPANIVCLLLWYNVPVEHQLSCCQLKQVATEFSCRVHRVGHAHPLLGELTLLWRGEDGSDMN